MLRHAAPREFSIRGEMKVMGPSCVCKPEESVRFYTSKEATYFFCEISGGLFYDGNDEVTKCACLCFLFYDAICVPENMFHNHKFINDIFNDLIVID